MAISLTTETVAKRNRSRNWTQRRIDGDLDHWRRRDRIFRPYAMNRGTGSTLSWRLRNCHPERSHQPVAYPTISTVVARREFRPFYYLISLPLNVAISLVLIHSFYGFPELSLIHI